PHPAGARPAPLRLALEPRILFDAAGAAELFHPPLNDPGDPALALHDDGGEDSLPHLFAEAPPSPAIALAPLQAEAPRREVVFIDRAVPDLPTLLQGIPAHARVVMLDADSDGVRQMAEALAGESGVDALHIFSHGGAGWLQLGSTELNPATVESHQADLAAWGRALAPDGDVMIYGCNVGDGLLGQAFLQKISQITAADAAASTDLTGSAARGGDWILESHTGSVETAVILSREAQNAWNGLLFTNERLSEPSDGVDATGGASNVPSISANGRYVVFTSTATNLVSGASGGQSHIYLYDTENPDNGLTLIDRKLADLTPSVGNAYNPTVSDNGQVVFESDGTDLLAAADGGANRDVFLYDPSSGAANKITRLSGTGGTSEPNAASYLPHISPDGLYAVFYSSATTGLYAGQADVDALSDIYLWSSGSGTVTPLTLGVAYTGNTQGYSSPVISDADGSGDRWVAYNSLGGGGYQWLFHQTIAQTNNGSNLTPISQTWDGTAMDGNSFDPSISQDGSRVAFMSGSQRLVAEDGDDGYTTQDIFLYDANETDLATYPNQIRRISISTSGGDPNNFSQGVGISPDGDYIVFQSAATNLVHASTLLNSRDVYMYNDNDHSITLVSEHAHDQGTRNLNSHHPRVSDGGLGVTFASDADDLVAGDGNGQRDVFYMDRTPPPPPPVIPINYSPELNPPYDRYVTVQNFLNDGAHGNVGFQVSALLGSWTTDQNTTDPRGVALVELDHAHGTWQYSLNDGESWVEIGEVSQREALLLPETDTSRIRFLPRPGFTGQLTVQFRAWDQFSGVGEWYVDAHSGGDPTAFSVNLFVGVVNVTYIPPVGVVPPGVIHQDGGVPPPGSSPTPGGGDVEGFGGTPGEGLGGASGPGELAGFGGGGTGESTPGGVGSFGGAPGGGAGGMEGMAGFGAGVPPVPSGAGEGGAPGGGAAAEGEEVGTGPEGGGSAGSAGGAPGALGGDGGAVGDFGGSPGSGEGGAGSGGGGGAVGNFGGSPGGG
ncbi:MAG: DUF4347 domain-containing protein, partial [Magnetococcales bacterium]|nr:DUF4347 domain-containing protein [Magnetococcales bacterium]